MPLRRFELQICTVFAAIACTSPHLFRGELQVHGRCREAAHHLKDSVGQRLGHRVGPHFLLVRLCDLLP